MESQEKLSQIAKKIRSKALKAFTDNLKYCDDGLEFIEQAIHCWEEYESFLDIAHLLDANKVRKAVREAWDLEMQINLPNSMLNLMSKYGKNPL